MMNINLSAPINSTGYGVASWNIINSLHNLGHRLSYFPIGQPSVTSLEQKELVLGWLKDRSVCDITAPYLKIWHQFDLLEHIGRGRYFAFPFFELDTFNAMEINSLQVPDAIFTTSKWASSIVSKHIPDKPVYVVPLGVDHSIFDYTKYPKTNSSKYIFLNIGKWEIRKGHDILLELFTKAFDNNPDIELWILASETTNGYSNKAELDQWKKMYHHPQIKLFSGVETHEDIAKLISESDCGIFPSRAEGWNLELLECMAMNKPVITTNYSAHTEFCDSNNSYLVEITDIEKAYDGKAFIGQGNWAKITDKEKDQIIDYMRYMANNSIRDNQYGVQTSMRLSWNNSAQTIATIMEKSS